MAAQRYKISLRVLKNISRVCSERVKYFSTREEKFGISKLPYNILLLNTNEILNHSRKAFICNHSNSDLFTCENNMLFSRVKISCFRPKAHLVFHWCL